MNNNINNIDPRLFLTDNFNQSISHQIAVSLAHARDTVPLNLHYASAASNHLPPGVDPKLFIPLSLMQHHGQQLLRGNNSSLHDANLPLNLHHSVSGVLPEFDGRYAPNLSSLMNSGPITSPHFAEVNTIHRPASIEPSIDDRNSRNSTPGFLPVVSTVSMNQMSASTSQKFFVPSAYQNISLDNTLSSNVSQSRNTFAENELLARNYDDERQKLMSAMQNIPRNKRKESAKEKRASSVNPLNVDLSLKQSYISNNSAVTPGLDHSSVTINPTSIAGSSFLPSSFILPVTSSNIDNVTQNIDNKMELKMDIFNRPEPTATPVNNLLPTSKHFMEVKVNNIKVLNISAATSLAPSPALIKSEIPAFSSQSKPGPDIEAMLHSNTKSPVTNISSPFMCDLPNDLSGNTTSMLPVSVTCPLCDQQLGTADAIKQHMTLVHNVHSIDPEPSAYSEPHDDDDVLPTDVKPAVESDVKCFDVFSVPENIFAKFSCGDCGAEFKSKDKLIVHVRKHTGQNALLCTICGKSFFKTDKLARHLQVHSGSRPHICRHCGATFTRSDKLRTHLKVRHNDTTYTCRICRDTFDDSVTLKLHQAKRSCRAYQPTECEEEERIQKEREQLENTVCEIAAQIGDPEIDISLMLNREKIVAKFDETLKAGTALDVASIVKDIVGGYGSSLDDSTEPNILPTSGLFADEAARLEAEKLKNKSNHERSFERIIKKLNKHRTMECPQCHIRLPGAYTLTRHMRTAHSIVKTYQYKKKDKPEQSEVVKIRPPKPPVIKLCQCQVCGKSFNKYDTLRRHEVTHSGERAFKCRYCDARYSRSDRLRKHLKSAHVQAAYPCVRCEEVFDNRIDLRHHTSVHRVRVPKPVSDKPRVRGPYKKRQPKINTESRVNEVKTTVFDSSLPGAVVVAGANTGSATASNDDVSAADKNSSMVVSGSSVMIDPETGDNVFCLSSEDLCNAIAVRNHKQPNYYATKRIRSDEPSRIPELNESVTKEILDANSDNNSNGILDAVNFVDSMETDSVFPCSYCGMKFLSEKSVQKHEQQQHEVDSGSSARGRKYECARCGSEFARFETLDSHSRRMHNESLYYCRGCDILFDDEMEWKKHDSSCRNNSPSVTPAAIKSKSPHKAHKSLFVRRQIMKSKSIVRARKNRHLEEQKDEEVDEDETKVNDKDEGNVTYRDAPLSFCLSNEASVSCVGKFKRGRKPGFRFTNNVQIKQECPDSDDNDTSIEKHSSDNSAGVGVEIKQELVEDEEDPPVRKSGRGRPRKHEVREISRHIEARKHKEISKHMETRKHVETRKYEAKETSKHIKARFGSRRGRKRKREPKESSKETGSRVSLRLRIRTKLPKVEEIEQELSDADSDGETIDFDDDDYAEREQSLAQEIVEEKSDHQQENDPVEVQHEEKSVSDLQTDNRANQLDLRGKVGKKGKKRFCKKCGKTFKKVSKLRRHLLQHPEFSSAPVMKKDSSKSINSSVYLLGNDNKEKMESAALEAGGEVNSRGLYQCRVCSMSFSMVAKLRRHVLIHSDNIPALYTCTHCSASYNDKEYLLIHIKEAHSDLRDLLCVECGKILKDAMELYVHIQQHEDQSKPKEMIKHADDKRSGKFVMPDIKTEESEDMGGENFDDFNEESVAEIQELLGGEDENGIKEFPSINVGDLLDETLGEEGSGKGPRGGNKHLSCPICNKGMSSQHSLKRHVMSAHTDERPYVCCDCPKAFSRIDKFRNHLRRHYGFIYPCTVCGATFFRWFHWKKHILIHSISCELCGFSCISQTAMARHIAKHTGEKQFTCVYCSKQFWRNYHLQIHIRKHTGEMPYSCDKCGKRFFRSDRLKRHLESHDRDGGLLCPTCGKSFTSALALKVHAHIHDAATPQYCQICDVTLPSNKEMRKHRKLVHPGEIFFYRCVCNKQFTSNDDLIAHSSDHLVNDQLPEGFTLAPDGKIIPKFEIGKPQHKQQFLCSICGRQLSSKHALIRHQRVHTGEKNFTCQICSRQFTTAYALSRHIENHENSKDGTGKKKGRKKKLKIGEGMSEGGEGEVGGERGVTVEEIDDKTLVRDHINNLLDSITDIRQAASVGPSTEQSSVAGLFPGKDFGSRNGSVVRLEVEALKESEIKQEFFGSPVADLSHSAAELAFKRLMSPTPVSSLAHPLMSPPPVSSLAHPIMSPPPVHPIMSPPPVSGLTIPVMSPPPVSSLTHPIMSPPPPVSTLPPPQTNLHNSTFISTQNISSDSLSNRSSTLVDALFNTTIHGNANPLHPQVRPGDSIRVPAPSQFTSSSFVDVSELLNLADVSAALERFGGGIPGAMWNRAVTPGNVTLPVARPQYKPPENKDSSQSHVAEGSYVRTETRAEPSNMTNTLPAHSNFFDMELLRQPLDLAKMPPSGDNNALNRFR